MDRLLWLIRDSAGVDSGRAPGHLRTPDTAAGLRSLVRYCVDYRIPCTDGDYSGVAEKLSMAKFVSVAAEKLSLTPHHPPPKKKQVS